MRLAGPVPSIRFEIHPHPPDTVEVRGVATGTFPPELAPMAREIAVRMAKVIEPDVRAKWEADQREYINRILYGDPTSKTVPRGILHGESPITTVARSAGAGAESRRQARDDWRRFFR